MNGNEERTKKWNRIYVRLGFKDFVKGRAS